MKKWIVGWLRLLTICSLIGWISACDFVVNELEGQDAIAQVKYATNTSLKETQSAVTEANFLVINGGIDGTAFYKFKAADVFMKDFITRTRLQATQMNSPQCQLLFKNEPRRSWWNPKNYIAAQCYVGQYEGAFYYLLYASGSDVAFLKIQGT